MPPLVAVASQFVAFRLIRPFLCALHYSKICVSFIRVGRAFANPDPIWSVPLPLVQERRQSFQTADRRAMDPTSDSSAIRHSLDRLELW